MSSNSTTTSISRYRQHGTSLLEVLISVLVFSTGILAIMALQAAAIKNSSAAKYRTDASYLANQLLGQLWSQRQTLESTPTDFAHRATGGTGAERCAPTGDSATHAAVTAWLSDVQARLPGATSDKQQVRVETAASTSASPVFLRVTVTVCWQVPGETTPRNHIEVAQLVGSPIN